jgi:lactose/cellobiose-specific phosphotransferase system IIC component
MDHQTAASPVNSSSASLVHVLIDKLRALTTPAWAFGPTLLAMRNSFLVCLPIVAVGVLTRLVNHFPLPWYQEQMANLFGPDWKAFGVMIWDGTLGVISVPMLVSISYSLTVSHNKEQPLKPINPLIAALVAYVAYFMIVPTNILNANNVASWFGSHGLLAAIIVALTATRLFLTLTDIQRLRMRIYSESLDSTIPQAFLCLLPGFFTILLFASLYQVFHFLTGSTLHEFIHDGILYPFRLMQDSFHVGSIAYVALSHALWFFGVHGANVLDTATHSMFEAIAQANAAASATGEPLPYLITRLFLNTFVLMGGCGSSLCLILAILIGSENRNSRRLAKISLVPGIFNINEILLFGLPVILNPIFLIPFLIVPLALTGISALAVASGLVPHPALFIEWTTPPILSGVIATQGGLAGGVLQVVNLIVGTLIYLPFVKVADAVKAEHQARAMRHLMALACDNQSSVSGKKCLDRDDEVGVLARVLAHDLELALKSRDKTAAGLYLEYQPQVDSRTGQVFGAEALLRWRHPGYGNVPPPIMVAIAEDADFIDLLGLWVLQTACAERARWRDAGVADHFKTSVNASVHQLYSDRLPREIARGLEIYRLEARMIGVEVTESVAIEPQAPHNGVLKQIHDMGAIVSIDDFGAGHSSLIYLKYFPVDILKIDHALSRDVVDSKTSADIIASIAELCHAQGIQIVVEFVETQAQVDVLNRLGCHIIQGYFYSKPLVGEQALEYILRRNLGALPQPVDLT